MSSGRGTQLGKESSAGAAKKKCAMVPVFSTGRQKDRLARNLPGIDRILEDTLSLVTLTEPLTKREMQILKLIIAGNTNKRIAQKLCRTERTVEYHRNRLMRKFKAHSAADLVKRATAVGIL